MEKEIILVGTFHFEQDAAIIAQKEAEINELVEHLSHFKPTKIALEWEASKELELNELYSECRWNDSMDEIHQIGFRLARQAGHDKVYAVNWAGGIAEGDMVALNTTIQDSYPDIVRTLQRVGECSPEVSPDIALMTSYKDLNDAKIVYKMENMYLSFIVVREGENQIGYDLLRKWNERELMIFKNVIDVCKDGDRLLLLVGGDHVWMLKSLFEGIGWKVTNPFADE
ncbi:DUF5694 domain-containing protein [Rossellomorea marisflavi]|uniref:DUF5694 domain-containing protein n=1 Tax=Rossellomorea marisflavi TaxID=189381 RepID=UPI00285361E5|nr:DUF5694 domain-containing protein [Rossellomorea marisflavi]MDR4936747.1 DUF5694 domain-containing protein [Rossellomorea marisflavi]